jgi:hypothetical protein
LATNGRQALESDVRTKFAEQVLQMSAFVANVAQFAMLLDTTLATQLFPWRKNPELQRTQLVAWDAPL